MHDHHNYYKADVSDILEQQAPRTPSGPDDPSGYLPGPGLVAAVNVALTIGRPLLLTGDPGTGKTQLARSLAWQLASRQQLNVKSTEVARFETKSTSVARDLFYTFDAIRCFQSSASSGRPGAPTFSNADFITYNALGRAVLRALPPGQVPPQVQSLDVLVGPASRTVVLIDEIDKAPRDFPNDILNEIDEMFFRVPELENVQVGGRDVISRDMRPIVVITSNSEKNLPDPFLRRCVYHHIPFPDEDCLRDILISRVSQFPAARGELVNDVIAFFKHVRTRAAAKRKISPAELLDWLMFMLTTGANIDRGLNDARVQAEAGLAALTKDPHDQESLKSELSTFLDKR